MIDDQRYFVAVNDQLVAGRHQELSFIHFFVCLSCRIQTMFQYHLITILLR